MSQNIGFGGLGTYVTPNIQPENQPEYPHAPPQEHQLKNDLHNSTLVYSNSE